MIMSLYFTMSIFMLIWITSGLMNPVKLSMTLMIFSMHYFSKMFILSSQVWFPFLYFLIFMGGILMMFMILSSTMPNEKTSKNKKLIFFLPLIVCFEAGELKFSQLWGASKQVKAFLGSSSSYFALAVLMLWYFFLTMLMVSKEETPMRKTLW